MSERSTSVSPSSSWVRWVSQWVSEWSVRIIAPGAPPRRRLTAAACIRHNHYLPSIITTVPAHWPTFRHSHSSDLLPSLLDLFAEQPSFVQSLFPLFLNKRLVFALFGFELVLLKHYQRSIVYYLLQCSNCDKYRAYRLSWENPDQTLASALSGRSLGFPVPLSHPLDEYLLVDHYLGRLCPTCSKDV